MSPFFSPELISTGKYNTYIAKALVARGNSVFVCCSHPLYPNWIPQKSFERLDGMSIFRGGNWLRYPKSPLIRRFILEIWFALHVLITVLSIRNKIDHAVVVFPPSLFVCFLKLILPKRVSLIGIVHDLQGVLGFSGAGITKQLFSFIVNQVEKFGFRKCESLILVSEGIKRQVIHDYGIDSQKCEVYYPFVTLSDEIGSGDFLTDIFQEGFKHIVYSGALGDKQNPVELLEIFQSLVIERNDVVCHIFSGGPLFEIMKKNQKIGLTGRILFHDLVAEINLPELFLRSTLHIIPQKTGTADAAFPSKLPNIIAAGVPVFAITDDGSELSRLVSKSGIGKSCSSWDRNVVVPLLSEFLNNIRKIHRTDNQKKVHNFVNQYFSIENVIDAILNSKFHVSNIAKKE